MVTSPERKIPNISQRLYPEFQSLSKLQLKFVVHELFGNVYCLRTPQMHLMHFFKKKLN